MGNFNSILERIWILIDLFNILCIFQKIVSLLLVKLLTKIPLREGGKPEELITLAEFISKALVQRPFR